MNRENVVTFSVIGAGGRANAYLAALNKHFSNKFKVISIAEPDKEKQMKLKQQYNIEENLIFNSYKEFCEIDKVSDVVIIGTLDDMHYEPTIKLLEKGYDIILEKPIAMDLEQIVEIGEIAKKYPNQLVAVCHVLRHTKFFNSIKKIIDSKELGNIINIQHNENIGYYHFAHSYVRGNWRNSKISTPLIVAKSCHDMDILLYLLKDKKCKKISSFGSLKFFNHKNYDPNLMSLRCIDCKIENKCPYSAIKIYGSKKIKSMVFDLSTEEKIKSTFSTSQYGRCVFACDNDVVDHQSTVIEFEDGVTATFSLSAFTSKVNRSLKIMCEYGEIRAIEKPYQIEIHRFNSDEVEILDLHIDEGGHGGGDENFIINFMDSYLNNKDFASTLDMSIESHVMAFSAEKSRINDGEVVDVQKLWQDTISNVNRRR